MMQLLRVEPETLPTAWPICAPMLEPALEYAGWEYALQDVYTLIEQNKAQLWVVVEDRRVQLSFVTQVLTFPRKRVCRLWLLGGSGLIQALSLFEELQQWAGSNGISSFDMVARPGMQRMLRQAGFKWNAVIMSIPVQRSLH